MVERRFFTLLLAALGIGIVLGGFMVAFIWWVCV
jgi:hypothetical protein